MQAWWAEETSLKNIKNLTVQKLLTGSENLNTFRETSVMLSPLMRHQDVVDAAEFDVDFEAEVGERLRRGFHHVLHLNTLSGHS